MTTYALTSNTDTHEVDPISRIEGHLGIKIEVVAGHVADANAHGNLWLSAADGVHCNASDGSLIGKILIPEAVANVCFGGPKLNRLFVCGTTSLYSVFLHTRAAPRP
mgnify:CR=1 FL=1